MKLFGRHEKSQVEADNECWDRKGPGVSGPQTKSDFLPQGKTSKTFDARRGGEYSLPEAAGGLRADANRTSTQAAAGISTKHHPPPRLAGPSPAIGKGSDGPCRFDKSFCWYSVLAVVVCIERHLAPL